MAEKILGWLKKKRYFSNKEDVKTELLNDPSLLKWKDAGHLNFSLLHWFVKCLQNASDDIYDLHSPIHSQNKNILSILQFVFEADTVHLKYHCNNANYKILLLWMT